MTQLNMAISGEMDATIRDFASKYGISKAAAVRVMLLTGTERGQQIEAALKVALTYGSIDGDHHKAWVIDQMVSALTDGARHMPDPGIAP